MSSPSCPWRQLERLAVGAHRRLPGRKKVHRRLLRGGAACGRCWRSGFHRYQRGVLPVMCTCGSLTRVVACVCHLPLPLPGPCLVMPDSPAAECHLRCLQERCVVATCSTSHCTGHIFVRPLLAAMHRMFNLAVPQNRERHERAAPYARTLQLALEDLVARAVAAMRPRECENVSKVCAVRGRRRRCRGHRLRLGVRAGVRQCVFRQSAGRLLQVRG